MSYNDDRSSHKRYKKFLKIIKLIAYTYDYKKEYRVFKKFLYEREISPSCVPGVKNPYSLYKEIYIAPYTYLLKCDSQSGLTLSISHGNVPSLGTSNIYLLRRETINNYKLAKSIYPITDTIKTKGVSNGWEKVVVIACCPANVSFRVHLLNKYHPRYVTFGWFSLDDDILIDMVTDILKKRL
jgi:hypothetical protein